MPCSSSWRAARARAVSACSRHACDRVGLVEPDRVRDGIPEPLDVRLAEDLLRLPPVGYAAIVQLTVRSFCARSWRCHGLDRARLADACLVEVGEQLGLGLAGDHDQRAAVRERLGARQQPRRRLPSASSSARMLDERACARAWST